MNNISYNSQAIVSQDGRITTNANNIHYNSQAIVSLNLNVDLMYQNSSAIVNHYNHFISLNDGKFAVIGNINGPISVPTTAFLNRSIDLAEGTLTLSGDLYLSSDTVITTSGKINLNGYSIILGNDFKVPDNIDITISSSGIIDGQGHSIILGKYSQLLLDSTVSLTYKNLTFKNSLNTIAKPAIRCLDWYSQITFDNVNFAFTDDFEFKNGQIFINDDVSYTGTGKFIYNSVRSSYILPHSSFNFMPNTYFTFAPSSTDNKLIVMQDKTSEFKFNNSALLITHTGLRLTTGALYFDNNVTVSTYGENNIASFNASYITHNYGDTVYCVNWSPDQKYLAVGGQTPTGGNELQVYAFNNSALSLVDSKNYGATLYSVNWTPDGKYIALGGTAPTSGDELQIYSFNGSALKFITSLNYGDGIYSVNWTPNGRYLAVGGTNPASGNELQIYSFDGNTLSLVTAQNYGDSIYSVNWSPDGRYLAIGGSTPDSGNELQIYSFNGVALSLVTSQDYGSYIYSVNWSPDAKNIAIGGVPDAGHEELEVYYFNGSSISRVAYVDYGSYVYSVNWNLNGRDLAIGGFPGAGHEEIEVYSFANSTLSLKASQNYGTFLYSVNWSPDGKYLGIGGRLPAVSHDEIEVYKFDYTPDISVQALTNSLVLGNSTLGSNNDLSTYILSGARVHLNGEILCDNTANSQDNLNFASRSSSINLEEPISKIKIINNEGISGWNQESILRAENPSNAWITDNTTYGYGIGETDLTANLVYNNSNAIVSLEKEVVYVSNATINNNNLIGYNSSVIIGHEQAIINNSNAIILLNDKVSIALNDRMYAFTFGPGDIYFDNSVTLSTDLFLSENHKLLIYNDMVIDGSNHFIDFSYSNSGLLYIDNNCTVTFRNINLRNMHNHSINKGAGAKIYFVNGSSLNFAYKYLLLDEWTLDGDVIINGNVNDIQVTPSGKFILAAGSNVTLQNLKLLDFSSDNFVLNDNVSVIFRDSELNLGGDLNLSKGSYLFEGDINITGTNKIIYQSDITSTIAKNTLLYFSVGTTLSVDPFNQNSNSFYFEDRTSNLYLDSANLYVSRGGLNLLNGTMFVNGVSSMQSEPYYDSGLSATVDNGITFGNQLEENDFFCNVSPSSMLDLFAGSLNYKNIAINAFILNKQYAPQVFLNISSGSTLNLYESLNIGNGIVIGYDNTKIYRRPDKEIVGSVNSFGNIIYGILD
ncbi:MAG: WD40 repeat, subgroup [candidate division TM6 bacterium GW2011_GWF2_28_16]|nr:MAG: WD40 repeat, subgroup [candidate division TM6 bacterium GW2011_GWF2_28_16]